MPFELTRTGIEGLDVMLGGGFPKGRCIIVTGGPGCGKTILGVQFLWNGLSKFDEAGVLVVLEEDLDKLREDMARLGFDLSKYENTKLKIVDHSLVTYLSHEEYEKMVKFLAMPTFKVASFIEAVKYAVKSLNAKRIVVDSLSALMFQEPDQVKRRTVTRLIFKTLRETGCTSLITCEIGGTPMERDYILEEYLADGVIMLQGYNKEGHLIRGIRLEKMRGIAHDTQTRPYIIGQNGISVFPSEKVIT
ncbi:MAG: ATPase domain-containing protein [Candidatus Bathyarchaeia archaeon]